jgi:nicotinate-nucleotide pyrophosphorylase (carboxylating)
MVCGMTSQALDALLIAALQEDAPYGDRTTQALGLSGGASGVFLAKEGLVLCGLPAALRTFELAGASCRCEALVEEGRAVAPGTLLARVSGPLPALLLAERPALNLLQHLSGIASLTRTACEAAEGSGARILDTRKTLPGFRLLDKYAVRTGGAWNHRMGLSDGILIKDNHIAAAGGVEEAVRRAGESCGPLWRVEVEVTSLAEFRKAVAAGAGVILLDNMSIQEMAQAASERPRGVLLEASGGMTLERLATVGRTGVDFISMGALTHSAKAVDISFEIGEKETATQ